MAISTVPRHNTKAGQGKSVPSPTTKGEMRKRGGGTPLSRIRRTKMDFACCFRIFVVAIGLQVVGLCFFFNIVHQSLPVRDHKPFFKSRALLHRKSIDTAPAALVKGIEKKGSPPRREENGTTTADAYNVGNLNQPLNIPKRSGADAIQREKSSVVIPQAHSTKVLSDEDAAENLAQKQKEESPITIRFKDGESNPTHVPCDVPCLAYQYIVEGGATNHPLTIDGTPFHFPIYTMEAPGYHPEVELPDDRTRAIQNTTFYATTHYNSDIPLPYYSPSDFSISNPMIDFDNAIKGASFIARNCASKNDRESVVKELTNLLRVDSISDCLHNAEPPNGLDMTDKGALMKKYLFHLAFENQNYDDYITEKLWGALASGALPVYMGPSNIREHLPHPDSVILVQDFETIEDLAKYLVKLSHNRTMYEAHHAWRKRPLPKSFRKKYDFTKTLPNCRLCRFIYAKLHDNVVWNHETQEIIRFPSAAVASAAEAAMHSRKIIAVSSLPETAPNKTKVEAKYRRTSHHGHHKTADNETITIRFSNGEDRLTHVPCDVPCQAYMIKGGGTNHPLTIDGTPFHFPIYTMEAPGYHPDVELPDERTRAIQNTTFYATSHYQSDVPLPYYSEAEYNIQNPAVDFDTAIKGASFIARNCNSRNKREKIVTDLSELMRVDRLGQCLHNAEPPNGLNMRRKSLLMQPYLFHLAIENQNYPDYLSEKVWETLHSGTLPVYLGAPNARDHLPDPNCMIFIEDFATIGDLAAYLNKVSHNRTLYEFHHAWRKKPLPESFQRLYNFTKTHSRCRICRFIYAKLHDDVVWDHATQEIIRFPSAAEATAAASSYARKSMVPVNHSSL